MHDFELNVEGISKIEGHADLYVKVTDSHVVDVQLRIVETKRYYTTAVEGKPCAAVPGTMSRICGTCSIAHLLAAIKAVESAMAITPSEQTINLRKLTMYALNIRDHPLHLYFFTLPDVLGVDSALEFEGKDEELLRDAFKIKEAANKLCNLVAGRPVHPAMPTVGGFLKIPSKQDFEPVVQGLVDVRPLLFKLLDRLSECRLSFKRPRRYFCVVNDELNYIDGVLKSSDGEQIEPADYLQHLERVVLPYSSSTSFHFSGQDYMVGALARLNINRRALAPATARDCAKYLERFPSDDSFDNNLAQGIEVVNCIDRAIELIGRMDFKPELPAKPTRDSGIGIGVVEAPRGTLYYRLEAKNGMVASCNVVIPTQQNALSIERDIKAFIESHIEWDREKLSAEIEKIVRAYDPCMSCATHFLTVHWS